MTNNYFFNLKIKIKSQDFKRPRIFSHLNRIIAFEWQFDNLLLFFFLQRLFINYFLLIYHYNPDCMTNVKFESLYFHFVGKKIKLHYNFVLIFCKLNNWSKYFQNKKKNKKKLHCYKYRHIMLLWNQKRGYGCVWHTLYLCI